MKPNTIRMFLLLISLLLTIEIVRAENNINDPASYCVGEESKSDIQENNIVLPIRLHSGDTVGLVSSGYRATDEAIEGAKKQIEALGLKVKTGKHIFDSLKNIFPTTNAERDFAGTDFGRADDLSDMFKDPDVKAIFEIRGGFGSDKILDLLDYELIKNNPKIIIGFSDITSLLLAINSKTSLITFHGPMPGAFNPWPEFTQDYLKHVLFDGEKVIFTNPEKNKIRTINSGIVKGKLVGGNFATLNSMIGGSDYLPKWEGAVLFLEDIGENCRRMDRMMWQLKNAGVLNKISGFIFGNCAGADCCPQAELDSIIDEYMKPLGIPAYSGAMIGHMLEMFTLPVGAMVEINANNGTVAVLEDVVI